VKVTSISAQTRNPDRVNISIDGKYRFSLDVYQVVDLGIRVGKDFSEAELDELENESQFGKLYARALEYCLMRPHSSREVRDYLWRKTKSTKYRSRSGELKERAGVSQEVIDRIFNRLVEKGYINDETFARWWIENRNVRKGTSLRKLEAELRAKGVTPAIITSQLNRSTRNEENELQKMIAKKQGRYDDPQKFKQYLMRQGFSYDAVVAALEKQDDD
jgi:regulatory protein